MTPAEFWGSIRAGGLTAEEELVEFWRRMRDCIKVRPQIGGGSYGRRIRLPDGLRGQQLEEDDFILVFLASVLQAGLLNK